jgi:hypothetical protein
VACDISFSSLGIIVMAISLEIGSLEILLVPIIQASAYLEFSAGVD